MLYSTQLMRGLLRWRNLKAIKSITPGVYPTFLKQWRKWKFPPRAKSPAAPLESLADFLDAAMYDPIMRDQILTLVELDSFNRQSILNTWLAELQLKGAPGELSNALACLKEDKVAARAKQLLKGE